MPEFPTSDEFNRDDVDLMQQFVMALWELLHRVTETGEDFQGRPLFEKRLRGAMHPALVETNPHFERLAVAIAEIGERQIADWSPLTHYRGRSMRTTAISGLK